MTVESRKTTQRSLQALLSCGALGARTDAQLLDLFRARRDETSDEAFRVLLDRHAAMVHGVCRGVLGVSCESDDAFQATFLVLVQKARSIRKGDSLGSWLHGVALRVAHRARDQGRRRLSIFRSTDHETLNRNPARDEGTAGASTAIHEEIERLPSKLREPLILCCLEGRSYVQAAQMLGLNESSLRGRLHRGRQTLEARLRKRGELGPKSPGSFLLATSPAPRLLETVLNLASHSPESFAPISETILALAKEATLAMSISTIKSMATATTLAGLCILGSAVVAQQQGKAPAEQTSRETAQQTSTSAEKPATPRIPPARVDFEKMNARINEALDQPFRTDLPGSATLENLLKAMKTVSAKADYSGIGIYVDPEGLDDAGASMRSEVFGKWNKVTLRTALKDSLRPLKLDYAVQDGFLMIDSRLATVGRRLDAMETKLDRILRAIEKTKPIE